VRGPAPSIVCPRCEREAPPQDAIGKLTTCRTCGLVFDAAPRERQVPVRRRRPEPEPEVEVAPEPAEKPAEKPEDLPVWRRPLTALQVVGILALIFGLAILMEEPEPRGRRGPEEAVDPWLAKLVARHRIASRFAAYGTDECVALGETLRREPVCPDPASELRLLEALDYEPIRAGLPERCSATSFVVEAQLRRLGCVRP
jgi:hypothetical protein